MAARYCKDCKFFSWNDHKRSDFKEAGDYIGSGSGPECHRIVVKTEDRVTGKHWHFEHLDAEEERSQGGRCGPEADFFKPIGSKAKGSVITETEVRPAMKQRRPGSGTQLSLGTEGTGGGCCIPFILLAGLSLAALGIL